MDRRTTERARHQTVLVTLLGFRKPIYSCTEGMCHSSTRPGTSYHVTWFYQAFPHISTASDKCWGEKACVRGYVTCTLIAGVIKNMVQKGLFQELVSRSHGGVDIEFAPAEVCQNKDDFLQTVFRFFAACMNTRDEIRTGVLIAGVSDEPPYSKVELRFGHDVVKNNLSKVFQRTVFIKEGDKERPLTDEEGKQLTLQFFMPTSTASDKQASQSSRFPVALCIVEPNMHVCGSSLYTVHTTFKRVEVLKQRNRLHLRAILQLSSVYTHFV